MAASNSKNLLVDCLICGLKRADRTPRLLACKHGFCQECLLETTTLQMNNQLQCPVCFQKTQLPENGVSDLKADSIVAEAFAALVALKEYYTCSLCILKGERKEAVAWCTNCEFRLCHICAEGHAKRPKFSMHVVVEKLCKIHIRDPSRACLTCRTGLCYECMLSGFHDDHDTCDITELKEKVTGVIAEGKRVIEYEISSVDKLMNKTMDESMDILKERRKETEVKLENYRKKMMESITTCLDKREEEFHRLVTKALGSQNEACSQASNCLNEVNILLEKGKAEILEQLICKTDEMFKSLNTLRSTKEATYSAPKLDDDKCETTDNNESRRYQFSCTLGGIISDKPNPVPWIKGNTDVAHILEKKPKNILDLKKFRGKEKRIQSVNFIAANDDGSALLGLGGEKYAVQLNDKGDITVEYPTCYGQPVSGIATYQGGIFLLSNHPSTITSFKGSDMEVARLNQGPNDAWDLAVDADSYFTTNGSGSFYQYSHKGVMQREIIKDRGYRFNVGVHPVVGTVYLVSAGQNLHVYKPDGKWVRMIGNTSWKPGAKLGHACGSAMLPNNHILIADNHQDRVTEVTFEGEFIRHLLTQEDGIKQPKDVAFNFPYLWVACVEAVLLFKYA